MKKIEHNGSTTGTFIVDEKTGAYFLTTQPNDSRLAKLMCKVVDMVKNIKLFK